MRLTMMFWQLLRLISLKLLILLISSNCTNAVAQNEPIHQLKMSQSPLAQNEPMLTREYQETTQEITKERAVEKKEKPKFSFEQALSFELPEGVDRNLWIAYIEMRQAMKKMPTQKAVELAISDLAKWGFEKANQSLKNSITSNWTGLFEPKQAVQTYTNAYSGYQTQASTRMSEIQELIAQEEQGNATYGF